MSEEEDQGLTQEQKDVIKKAIKQAEEAKDRSLEGWGGKPGETREEVEQRDEETNPSKE